MAFGIKKTTAVIVVDVQGDFTQLRAGSLAVEGTGQDFIDQVREHTRILKQDNFPIYATQDWHPPGHVSFFTTHKNKRPFDVIPLHGKQQVLWPPHCVQGTEGAKLLVNSGLFDIIVKKGTKTDLDSYSGFQDDGGHPTPLHRSLQERGITHTIIYGIATDYCVRATALDAVALGYRVMVIRSLIRGVSPETSRKALDEMEQRGVVLIDDVDRERIRDFSLSEGGLSDKG